MSVAAVSALYDALQVFEGRRRGARAYPIHKRLDLADSRHDDVYEWVGDQLELQGTDRLLDVGCGVGFGTIRLAERGVERATGITISPRELEFASEAATRSPRAKAIEFLERSFDRPPPGPFDVITAVESLQHATDLPRALRALYETLAPGGRLGVVADLFDGDPQCSRARRLVSDWHLPGLYGEADYTAALPLAPRRVVDLSAGVHLTARLARGVRLAALNVALLVRATPAARAFRGGVHLEALYATGQMRYMAMFWSKPGRQLG